MNLLYKSTRNAEKTVTASEAILKGLAEDGGLFVPVEIPKLDVTMDDLKDSFAFLSASSFACDSSSLTILAVSCFTSSSTVFNMLSLAEQHLQMLLCKSRYFF